MMPILGSMYCYDRTAGRFVTRLNNRRDAGNHRLWCGPFAPVSAATNVKRCELARPHYPHDLVDAWAAALMVTTDTASPLRDEHGWLSISFDPCQCHTSAEVGSNR